MNALLVAGMLAALLGFGVIAEWAKLAIRDRYERRKLDRESTAFQSRHEQRLDENEDRDEPWRRGA